MLQKFFLFFLVVLFGSLSQASDVEDYVNNIIESALNKNIRASSYFLSEINRLEDAGADFQFECPLQMGQSNTVYEFDV